MMSVDRNYSSISIPFMLILVLFGLLTGFEVFFVSGLIPLVFLILSDISRSKDFEGLIIEREISSKSLSPGEEVEVELNVVNSGSEVFGELRLIDGVPSELEVSEGSPRACISLSPNSSESFSYSLTSRRGKHFFRDVDVSIGSGSSVYVDVLPVEGDNVVECATLSDKEVVRDGILNVSGGLMDHIENAGIEFHSIRDYRKGDDPSRVDWNHFAKTGNLSTKKFSMDESGEVILVVDCRKLSDIKAGEGHPSAVNLSIHAAFRLYLVLLKMGYKPGMVVLGAESSRLEASSDANKLCYVSPGNSSEKIEEVERMLDEVRGADKRNSGDMESKLYGILPSSSDLIFFSPVLDDKIVSLVSSMSVKGFRSTVVSPDVTYCGDRASRFERVRRDIRLDTLNEFCAVVDWNIRMPLSGQLSKALNKVRNETL